MTGNLFAWTVHNIIIKIGLFETITILILLGIMHFLHDWFLCENQYIYKDEIKYCHLFQIFRECYLYLMFLNMGHQSVNFKFQLNSMNEFLFYGSTSIFTLSIAVLSNGICMIFRVVGGTEASLIHFLMLSRCTFRASITDLGSKGFDPLKSKWWAPSGIMTDITESLIFLTTPPEDHGSLSPLL